MELLIVACVLGFLPPKSFEIKKPLANDITIYGKCWDVLTGTDLKIKATALFSRKEATLGESADNGRFEFQVPDSTKYLMFEKKGYNSITIPVNFIGKIEKGDRFPLDIPMIAKDSQQVSRVYALTEKQKGITETKKVAFEVRGARNGELIKARVCLTNTQTGKVDCLETNLSTTPAFVMLHPKAKIAFIVSSNSYQDYIGSLINQETSDENEVYRIRLLYANDPLSLYYDVPDSLELSYGFTRIGAKGILFPGKGKNPLTYIWKFGAGQYNFTATNSEGVVLMNETMTTISGFNFKSVHIKKPTEPSLEKSTSADRNFKTPPFRNKTVYFDQSSYQLKKETTVILDSIISFLRSSEHSVVHVTGHSDNVGKRDLNLMLSEHRARVVTHYLKLKGIPANQLIINWKGPDIPVTSNDSEENKVKNRRVEINISNR